LSIPCCSAATAIQPKPLPTSHFSYTFLLGLLFPAYSFTGLDGPAHMSEESTNASMAAPWGIILGVAFM
jgi:amino acid transporter